MFSRTLRAVARPQLSTRGWIRGREKQRAVGAGEILRKLQFQRLAPFGIFCNAQMPPRRLRRFCKLDAESEKQMENAITRLGLSARAYDKVLKVSRTMGDLEGSEKIQARHVSEAIQYRTLDRAYWQG